MAQINLNTHPVKVGDSLVIGRKLAKGRAWYITIVDVIAVSDKAVRVAGRKCNIKCWLPKSALIVNERPETWADDTCHSVSVARWFKIDEWYARLEDIEGDFGGI